MAVIKFIATIMTAVCALSAESEAAMSKINTPTEVVVTIEQVDETADRPSA